MTQELSIIGMDIAKSVVPRVHGDSQPLEDVVGMMW